MGRNVSTENHSVKRYVWADVIRIVAIFLVVYVHQLYLLPELTYDTLWIWVPNLFTNLGVPLFVMISGALLLAKSEPLGVFFRKRIRVVVIPWIFWIAVYSLVDVLFNGLRFSSLFAFFSYEYRMFFSRFWFLPMILGLYFLTPLMRVFVKNASVRLIQYAVILWFFTIVLFPFLSFLFTHSAPDTTLLRYVMQYSGLFLLGYMLVHRQTLSQSRKVWLVIFLLSLILTYVGSYLNSFEKAPFIDRAFSRIFSPTMIPGVVALFMFLYLTFKNITLTHHHFLPKIITETSKAALGVYLVHELVQEFLVRTLPNTNNVFVLIPPLLAVPTRAIVVFVISLGIILFLRRMPVLKYLT